MTAFQVISPRVEMGRRMVKMRKLIAANLHGVAPSPVWDMLLELYLAEHETRDVSLYSLYMAAYIPPPTAHRRVKDMEQKGLLVRDANESDRRRINVTLTAKGREFVEEVLDELAAFFIPAQGDSLS